MGFAAVFVDESRGRSLIEGPVSRVCQRFTRGIQSPDQLCSRTGLANQFQERIKIRCGTIFCGFHDQAIDPIPNGPLCRSLFDRDFHTEREHLGLFVTLVGMLKNTVNHETAFVKATSCVAMFEKPASRF